MQTLEQTNKYRTGIKNVPGASADEAHTSVILKKMLKIKKRMNYLDVSVGVCGLVVQCIL